MLRLMSRLLWFGMAGALAACAGDVGSGGDGGVDGPPPIDADPHGAIDVSVVSLTGDGMPEVGATVIVKDSEKEQTATTSAAGTASATVLPGATVTVARRIEGNTFLTTVIGAEPGDQLHFGQRGPVNAPVLGKMTFTFPLQPGASRYELSNGCKRGTGSPTGAELEFAPGCGAGPHDVLITAFDTSQVLLGWLTALDVAFVADGSQRVTDSFTPARRFTASYTGVGAPIARFQTSRRTLHEGRTYMSVFKDAVPTDGTATNAMPYADFGERMNIETFFFTSATALAPRQLITHRAGSSDTYAMDASTELLPWLSNVQYDVATRTATWARDSSASGADAVVVRFRHRRSGNLVHEWWLIAPPDVNTVTLPALPADLEVAYPAEAAGLTLEVKLVDLGHREGFKAFRQGGEPDILNLSSVFETDHERRSEDVFAAPK